MRVFLSFIIAVAIYFVIGLIAWNIVCSNFDIDSMTITSLSDYQLSCYAVVTFILTCIIPHFSKEKIDESYYLFPLIVVGVNLGIAIAVNHWEGAWESVTNIIGFLFNIINIAFLTYILYFALLRKSGE